ncbi:MAG: HAD family hydrolase [Treponemataceae bacterium]|nr:HAD family hydrolase [Treponemataceae bacterium]
MKFIAALFDLDGVVIDTESQYTVFWDMIGRDFLHIEDFGPKIKGQSLTKIFADHFSSCSEEQISRIHQMMDDLEVNLNMNYIPGVVDFINELRSRGIKTAVVTSSNRRKMESVYVRHPEILKMFDEILTAEDFPRGKPCPDCYLIAAEKFGASPDESVVFEDSYSGLEAGRNAKMKVIGLATTHTKDEIKDKADYVISDFAGFSVDKLLSI